MAATALTGERLARMVNEVRVKITALASSDPQKALDLDKGMDVDFAEHFQYQQMQAESHAMGLLTPEAAQIVYNALGESGSQKNGGWASGTDTATKVVVTQLMGELVKQRLKQKGVKV